MRQENGLTPMLAVLLDAISWTFRAPTITLAPQQERSQWLAARQADVLPVPYHPVVFMLPVAARQEE
jgi:hypothetical protein